MQGRRSKAGKIKNRKAPNKGIQSNRGEKKEAAVMEENISRTTTMMMMIRSPENLNETKSLSTITTPTCPTWKLYENPFYYSPQNDANQNDSRIHQLHLPLSARQLAASFRDLTIFMDSDLDSARSQIEKLRAELDLERNARKKLESMNNRLTKVLTEERMGREAIERVCEELAKEMAAHKAEINRMKREMEEERRMLRMAEVLREERVHMKLAEAKLLFQEKLFELEHPKIDPSNFRSNGESGRLILGEKRGCSDDYGKGVFSIHRKASPEAENPHIKRGIKGFVEFPRVVRAIGSKSRDMGMKLECQRAQLRILLKQKSPISSNSNLILS